MTSAWHNDEVKALDKMKNVRLPSIGNYKQANYHQGREEIQMGKKHLYMGYSQVEVNKTRENGMVMDDGEDGKDWMIDMETVKNG
jgi:hypothetical protein